MKNYVKNSQIVSNLAQKKLSEIESQLFEEGEIKIEGNGKELTEITIPVFEFARFIFENTKDMTSEDMIQVDYIAALKTWDIRLETEEHMEHKFVTSSANSATEVINCIQHFHEKYRRKKVGNDLAKCFIKAIHMNHTEIVEGVTD